MFNGVPFPSFALFVPPLAGTKVCPYPPRTEKFHFLRATGAPINHLDGTVDFNNEYLDLIIAHMDIRFMGWENATALRCIKEISPDQQRKV